MLNSLPSQNTKLTETLADSLNSSATQATSDKPASLKADIIEPDLLKDSFKKLKLDKNKQSQDGVTKKKKK